MSVRRTLAAAIATALAGSAIALSAGPASAAVDPDDTTIIPTTADLIGVGSDTSQHAIKLFAESWNGGSHAAKIATFAATGGGTITLPTSGETARPNGSGSGKALLYGAGNKPDVDFARSSSANSAPETAAGLQAFPFALDTLVMAVSSSTPSNAPTALTPAQIVSIYKGEITNWSQIDPTKSGVIAPKTPQPGSGTRSFWDAQLKAMNGGVTVTYAGTVAEVQEHDDSQIKNNPNAIAPFSRGRAALLGSTLRIETGWSADRALYNVVRGTDLGNALIQEAFGENGALCSTASRSLIEAAGFKQLATPARGGVCGAATQATVTNFATNEQVITTTTLAVTSPSAKAVKLVATVAGSTAPSGTVDFYEGVTKVKASVPLVSSTATATLSGVTPGAHTYRAVFVPGAGFDPSEATSTVTVKAQSPAVIKESFPAKVKLKKAKAVAVKGVVSIKGATGKVVIKKGKKVLKKAVLKAGKAKVTLPKLKKGVYKLTIAYAGDAAHLAGTKTFTIKIVK